MEIINVKKVRLFIGYCGWNAGELEAEIEEGSWQVTNAPVDLVFAASVTELWQKLHAAVPG